MKPHTVTEGPWQLTPDWLFLFGKPFYRRRVSSSCSPSTFAYEYTEGFDFGIKELREAWFSRQ